MAFFFHYNKPLSQKFQKVVISLHYQKQCVFVDNVVCHVPIRGRLSKRQPRFVMTGKAKTIEIRNGVAEIR